MNFNESKHLTNNFLQTHGLANKKRFTPVPYHKMRKQCIKTMIRLNEGLTILLVLTTNTICTNSTDTINTTQVMRDGETLISSGGSFELGFFRPGNSTNRYVGIWYKKITSFTVVWVANRDNPLTNASGATLRVTGPSGQLVLMNGNNDVIWSSSNTTTAARNPVAQLLDSGNFVIREADNENPDNYMWQSFDYPTDTFLPGMKFGRNLETGQDTYITAWKTSDDPGGGDYSYRLDPTGYPQLVLRRGSMEVFRSGPWNGIRFSGQPGLRPNPIYTFGLVYSSKEVYYHYELINSSVVSRFTLNQFGVGQRLTWLQRTQDWAHWGLYLTVPSDSCDNYRQCGAFGSCNVANSPICGCLEKFTPRYPNEWLAGDWSNGCVRGTPLNCRNDGFRKYSGIKLPDTRKFRFNDSMTLIECKEMCLRNCSCTAYSKMDIRRGRRGCFLWFDDLVDIRELSDGQDIYIRMASSESDSKRKSPGKVLIVCLTFVGMILLGLCIVQSVRRKFIYLRLMERGWHKENHSKDLELPLFDLSTISKATNNFSRNNKLGEGGFGPVYKGVLVDGQEIAVKRLSKSSVQGFDEFKNEVNFIAKLQHRNLVKLIGCCIQGEEKMLIYEYMPNKSLDLILFDETKKGLLDWPKRIHIINGIARGLMYLHQDSRLRIIHRDLKASNILLDDEMKPKISDFGLARSFVGNQIEANTSRVVGTYGYMSPEYAVDGLFSIKSDVFSFGVLVIEILSGKRNRGFSHRDHNHNLVGHAWLLFKERRSIELIDSNLEDSCYLNGTLKTIHVGLLCVQKYPEDRPKMSSVVFMLENEVALPQPKEPGFFTERDAFRADTSTSTKTSSTNEITITLPEPR